MAYEFNPFSCGSLLLIIGSLENSDTPLNLITMGQSFLGNLGVCMESRTENIKASNFFFSGGNMGS